MRIKKKNPHRPAKRRTKGEAKSGALYLVAALGIIILFGTVMAGGALPKINPLRSPAAPGSIYSCCDSGDGPACHPILDKTITFKGEQYALLKPNVAQPEMMHMVQGGETTPDGHQIYVNDSNNMDYTHDEFPECKKGMDLIALDDPTKKWGGCAAIPDDELIYVCKDTIAECDKVVNEGKIPFDTYFRLKDGPVPALLSTNCPKPQGIDPSGTQQQVISIPTPGGRKNLQLETFQVKQEVKLTNWSAAWCKPAINLYPTKKTQVHVQVAPKGQFTLTIPTYPAGGWNVTAYPDGKVVHNNITYPYLYWEASIPDEFINFPKEGFVVEHDELSTLFSKLMPRLGLNERESNEFASYWLKTLPASPYYFVGVIPEDEVDEMAPLSIVPAPDSVLRVSLYFKALDSKFQINPPILSGFERKGFTVTEWGGFFKADKAHEGFTCLM